MKYKREQRVNSELNKLIYDILKNKISYTCDLEMFSITEVNVTPDLKSAKVYVSIYSTSKEKKEQTFNCISNASAEVRRHLASVMRTRTVPELRFILDEAEEYGNKIETILSKLTYGDNNDNK